MSQTETGKAAAADERTEAARSFVRTVKAATRRKYTPEEKIRIVPEGFRREIRRSSYYRWLRLKEQQGLEDNTGGGKPPWNKLASKEVDSVLAAARDMPELSCRQLAAWITDNMGRIRVYGLPHPAPGGSGE